MSRNISDLFGIDSNYRWTIIKRSAMAVIVVGILLMLANVSIQILPIWAGLAGTVAYFGQIFTYSQENPIRGSLKSWRSYGFAFPASVFATVAILACVAYRSAIPVQAAVINWRLGSISNDVGTPSKRSSNELRGIASAIAAARKQNIPIRPDIENRIRAMLVSSNSDSPNYWSAAGALVSYQSPEPHDLPDCFTTKPEHLTWKPIAPEAPSGAPPPDQVTYSDCRLDLNSGFVASEFNVSTPTNAVSIVCQRCEVVYSGGSLPISRAKGFVNLLFNDCSFSLQEPANSPEEKGLISTILHADDPKHVHYVAAGKVIPSPNGDVIVPSGVTP